jgi:ribosomal protein S12 methylthiotransferase accessory factor YcaO
MINKSSKGILLYQSPTWQRDALVSTYSDYPRHSIQCGATDVLKTSMIKSMGELTERLCLYTLQAIETRKYIASTFSKSGFQIDYIQPSKLPDAFDLDLVWALDLISNEQVLIPLSLISFHRKTHGFDVFPNGDTTGCAVHTSLKDAFENALMEFCERQAFFGCFFGSLPILEIEAQDVFLKFKNQLPPVYQNGVLLAMDLGYAFNCHVEFTLLISTDANACQVVTGLGTHLDKKTLFKSRLTNCFKC